ncbi:response regulator NasT [Anaerobium acetethylicum]|uniref:Response regulator NasT n=2 Tax=Anaerobium acetethylicum TaxID=1619234 RepID=A0A1D3TVX9_9FIRM|nr:response regulator NasT [Anaerobium acetethylicum]
MTKMVVVFSNHDDAVKIRNLLVRQGFSVVAVCTTGAQAIQAAERLSDGIIVCGYKYSDMIYRQLREYLRDEFEMLLVASHHLWSECSTENVICLGMPLKVNELTDTLEMMENSMARKRKQRKLVPRERSEDEKKLILEAKALLMERNNMTEEDAHRYIQKRSMDSKSNMVDMAKSILSIMRD